MPDDPPASFRDFFQAKLEAVGTRLDAIDRATEVFNDNLTRVPTDTDKQISHLKELNAETFGSIRKELDSVVGGINKQFEERDIRTRASEVAAQTAVNAALSAQKEAASAQNDANAAAITKAEASTVKQIDGIVALLTSGTKATDEKIGAINARLDRGEGTGAGRASSQATILSIAALVVSVIIGGVSVVTSLRPAPTAVMTAHP